MSDYRWEGSPYQPTPSTDIHERIRERKETLERALYKIALDAKSLEHAQHIASEVLYRQQCAPQ